MVVKLFLAPWTDIWMSFRIKNMRIFIFILFTLNKQIRILSVSHVQSFQSFQGKAK
jgi:hypothetical protein